MRRRSSGKVGCSVQKIVYQMSFTTYCENTVSELTTGRSSVSACAMINRSNGYGDETADLLLWSGDLAQSAAR